MICQIECSHLLMFASVMQDIMISEPTMYPSAHASKVNAAGSVGFSTFCVSARRMRLSKPLSRPGTGDIVSEHSPRDGLCSVAWPERRSKSQLRRHLTKFFAVLDT